MRTVQLKAGVTSTRDTVGVPGIEGEIRVIPSFEGGYQREVVVKALVQWVEQPQSPQPPLLGNNSISGRGLNMHDSVPSGCGKQCKASRFRAAVVEDVEDELLVEGAFEVDQLELQLPLPGSLQPCTEGGITFGLKTGGCLQIGVGGQSQQSPGETRLVFGQRRISGSDVQHDPAFLSAFGGDDDGISAVWKDGNSRTAKPCHLRHTAVADQHDEIHRDVFNGGNRGGGIAGVRCGGSDHVLGLRWGEDV